jgi:regulatory protein
MPFITEIKLLKRSDDRFSVCVDGEYAFALSSLDLSGSSLRVGQEITVAELEHYRVQSDESQAYNLAVRFLSYRPRSKREINDHLGRKGCTGEQVASVTDRLERAGLLNDKAFSAAWIANRQALRPRSKRQLEHELMAKGVARDDISGALQEIDGESELELLVAVAERKRQMPQYREPSKLIGYLARQGYTYDLIKKALERLE